MSITTTASNTTAQKMSKVRRISVAAIRMLSGKAEFRCVLTM